MCAKCIPRRLVQKNSQQVFEQKSEGIAIKKHRNPKRIHRRYSGKNSEGIQQEFTEEIQQEFTELFYCCTVK